MLSACAPTAFQCLDCESRFPNDARYRRGTELYTGQCPTVDDGRDNDGDGRVDEELCDGLDNDGDGRVDEDTYENDLLSLAATPSLGGPGTAGLTLALMILGPALVLRRGRGTA